MQTQLQVFSSFSLLKSPNKVKDLVDTANQYNYKSIALTDINNLYGSIEFYKYAKKIGIKPIIGLTTEIKGLINTTDNYRMILLAKNKLGYQNLLKISSKILMNEDESIGFNGIITDLSGIFVISSPIKSELLSLDDEKQVEYLNILKTSIDADSLYIGIMSNESFFDSRQQLIKISKQHSIPMVFTENILYLNSDEAFATQVLELIDKNDHLNNPIEFAQKKGNYYLKEAEEFSSEYEKLGLVEVLKNTQKVADECNVEIEFKRTQLPKFKTPNDQSSEEYLKKLVVNGLKLRLTNVPDEYQKRALYELDIINKMGFADYFLIVWDVIRHAHKKGIITGPGRGSAAGSLIAYALKITEVDPIEYNLLFERFLNPERISMPDIDLDIPDTRRDELVLYMQERYGKSHMSQIITFGTLAAKQALRDVGRVFGQSMAQMSHWSKLIPSVLKIDLRTAFKKSAALREQVNKSELNKLLFKTAMQIEGLPRHFSTHAAGIVLSNRPLIETVAIRMGSDGIALTQQTKDYVEELGLLKIDFLGLTNLTILDNAIKNVTYQVGKKLLTEKINLNDQKTLELFQKGDTNGVFQFESSGIKQVLRKIHPNSFDDIVATNALYRPGPMQNIDTFAARKNGDEPIVYPDDSIRDILRPTYGILVYQEQVMQVASKMAGFSLSEADSLRRAMAKKHKNEIDELRNKFIEGAVSLGHAKEKAIVVYDYIEKFANYGFNKSHAVAYSKVAFWLAYIKVHFPSAFYTAILNSNLHDDLKTRNYIQEAKKANLKISGPNINTSQIIFSSDRKNIFFGLVSIKGIRSDMARNIISVRQNGKFTSLENFLQRLDSKFVKVEYIEPLILSDALSDFSENKRALLYDARDLIESIQLSGNNVSLLDILSPKKHVVEDFSAIEKLNQEIKFLGTYVSGHPVENYRTKEFSFVSQLKENSAMKIVVLIKDIRVIRTKRGDQMAFITGEDETGEISITVFPELYKSSQEYLDVNNVLFVYGKLSRDKKNQLNFVANSIKLATNTGLNQALFIRVPEKMDTKKERVELLELLKLNKGDKPVVIFFPSNDEKVLLSGENSINYSANVKAELVKKYGIKNIFDKSE